VKANLIKRYQVKVSATYYTFTDIEDVNESEAIDLGVEEFYSESHRAEIDNTEIYDEWLYCTECGDEKVEDDHECEEVE
jgi:hypothetical protein